MAIHHVKSNTIADFTGTVTVQNSAGGTQTAAATNLVRPVDWNSQHSVIYTLGGNTAVQSTAGGTDLQIHGAGNITVAGSTGSLVISGPQWSTYNQTQFGHVGPAAQTSTSLAQNTIFIYSHLMERWCSGVGVRLPVQVADQTTGSSSGRRGLTIDWGIYSRHPTNSTVLTLMYSTTWTIEVSHSSTNSFGYSMITGFANSTSYVTTTFGAAASLVSASLHGGREFVLPFSSTLGPGEYWIAEKWSTSVAGTTQGVLNCSRIIASVNTMNRVGLSPNVSNPSWQKEAGCGRYSATSATLPDSIDMTQIYNHGWYPVAYWNLLTA